MKRQKHKLISEVLNTLAPVGMAQLQTRAGKSTHQPVYSSDEFLPALLARWKAQRECDTGTDKL